MTSLLCKYLDVLTATLTTYISISLFHHFIVFFRKRLAFSLEGSVGFLAFVTFEQHHRGCQI